ncbi:unnamed protein product [Thlaspi arvense]|uniref:Protein kinase domain-containing protein n=1 Tax=Thlaspi arvense TaxID=13288 RepID=A0AAU9SU09_THLAR|nr:unnamed protein product [Thlaspi arvense]
MGLDESDAVKAKGNCQSEKSNESENKKKKKKNRSNGDNRKVEELEEEGEEREASGCWVKFRFMIGCIPSKSDVDASSSLYGTTSTATTMESKSANEKSIDQPVGPVSSTTTTSNAESSSSTPMISEELKLYSNLRKFTFNDLKLATRNFRPESLLGEGGFGCVFKGWIEENGTAPVKPGTGLTVAVKTLNPDGLQGSLPLPWSIRMKIALGAAKGLSFLHEEALKPVIYRDFKTSNILLDADYNAKLSDFGLAKDAPDEGKTHVSTRVMGTYGYAAPEPHLLDKRRFYRLLDPRLEGHFSVKGAQKVTQLAAQCLSRDPKIRPKMSDVVEALKPLPHLKDMASSSYYFQTMQAERLKNGSGRTQGGNGFGSRNGHPQPVLRTLSSPHGQHGSSPYRHQIPSPKPKGATT